MTDRYDRQVALPEIGPAGQARLRETRALVVGAGALGSNAAALLVRAGVGGIKIVDFDLLELSNLQRQALVTEADVGRLKAEVLAARLGEINSEVRVEYEIARIDRENAEGLLAGADIVFDGLDNYPARYLVNDACVKHGVPWVFTAVAGTYGEVMPIIPGKGACLRCLIPDPPPESAVLTAGTSGLLNSVPRAAAAIAVAIGIKTILGQVELPTQLVTLDLWDNGFGTQAIPRNPGCPCCGAGEYEFLERS